MGGGGVGWGVRTVGAQHVKYADSSKQLMVGELRVLHGWLDLLFLFGLCVTLLFSISVRYGVRTIKNTGAVSVIPRKMEICL